jgi:hypothetical protein
VRGADVKSLGGGRFRFTFDLAAAGAAKGVTLNAMLNAFSDLDRKVWTLDDEGLARLDKKRPIGRDSSRPGAVLRTPATLRVPLTRIEAVDATLVPDGFAMITLTGLAESAHTALNYPDGRGFLLIGALPIDDELVRNAIKRMPPKGAQGFDCPLTKGEVHLLRIDVAHAKDAEAASEVRVSIDGKQVVKPSGPRQLASPRGEPSVEFRAHHGARLLRISIEGAPDWISLAKKK